MRDYQLLALISGLLLVEPNIVLADQEAEADSPHNVALTAGKLAGEVNVLWPFFPGGIAEFKALVPIRSRGEALIGLNSDFKQRKRFDKGRVRIFGLKIGYRQYLWRGLHAEAALNFAWRREHNRPTTGRRHHNFVISSWGMVGYQIDLGSHFYANGRGGVGHISYRSSDWPNQEKGIFGVGDVNFGVYF